MVKRKVDFTNVTDGFVLIPEGEYIMHVFNIEDKPSKDGAPGVSVTLKVAEDGEFKGKSVQYYLSEKPGALWKVREFLEACGAAIPKKAVMVDYDKCLGKTVVATIGHIPGTKDPSKMFPDVKQLRKLEEGDVGTEEGGSDDDLPPF